MKIPIKNGTVEGDMSEDLDKFEANLKEMRMKCTERRITSLEILVRKYEANRAHSTMWLGIAVIALVIAQLWDIWT